MKKEDEKKQTAKELEERNQQFKENLEQVFTLARLQMVTSNPADKKGLIDLINFESQAVEKLN